MKANRYKQIAVFASAVLIFALSQTAVAGPPEIPGNPGVPGLLAEISELNQMIGEQNSTIEELHSLLDAMKNYAPVPQTGQTEFYHSGDDGDLQMGVPWPTPRFTDQGEVAFPKRCNFG